MEADEKTRLTHLETILRQREQDLAMLATLVSSWARARITGDPLDEALGAPEVWRLMPPEDPEEPWRG
jgi:hypothetical protein